MGLHDPGAVLFIWLALRAGHIGRIGHVFGTHAHWHVGVAAHHQVNALDCAGHFHVAWCLNTMLAIGIVAHVGGRYHQIGLCAQLRHELGGLLDRAAKLQLTHVLRVAQFLRVVRCEAHDRHAQSTQIEQLVRLENALAAPIDIRRQQGKRSKLALHGQNSGAFVELMVAHRHGVIAQQVHAFEIRYRVLQIGLGHAGVDVATVEQQAVAASGSHFGADGVDHGLARRHAVFAVLVVPETAMVVIGVQHRDGIGAVSLRAGGRQMGASGQRQQQEAGSG